MATKRKNLIEVILWKFPLLEVVRYLKISSNFQLFMSFLEFP